MLFMFLWFVWNQPVLRMLKYEDIDRLFAQKGLYVLVDFNYHCSICSSYFIRCSKITSLFFQSVVNKVIIIIMTIIIIRRRRRRRRRKHCLWIFFTRLKKSTMAINYLRVFFKNLIFLNT